VNGAILLREVVGALVLLLALVFWSRKSKSGVSFLAKTFGGETRPALDRDSDRVYHGATLIVEDSGYRPDWNAAMLREFGDDIEPELDRLFEIAQEVASHPRDEWVWQIKEYRGETIWSEAIQKLRWAANSVRSSRSRRAGDSGRRLRQMRPWRANSLAFSLA